MQSEPTISFQGKINTCMSEDDFYRAIKLRKVKKLDPDKLQKTINAKLRGVK